MAPRAGRSGTLTATVFALAGVIVLVGLGGWQLERKGWKEALIASITARLAAAPIDLPPRGEWAKLDQANDEFRRVKFSAELGGDQALIYTAGSPLRPDVTGAGYWVLAPARLAGGGTVVVNRGFVPLDRKDAARSAPPSGRVEIVGVLRWPEVRGMFTPSDEPQHNLWFARDVAAIAAAKQWGQSGEVAPFSVDQEQPQSAGGGLPRAGALTVSLPNNHLQYAITWFALAAGLAGVYLIWLSGKRRRR